MATLTISPPTSAIAPVGINLTALVVGSGTSFVANGGFSLSGGGADAILLSQTASDATHASLVIGVGMTPSVLTLTDTGSGASTTLTTSNPAGYYAALTDLYAEFGPQNIAAWSNLGGNSGYVDVSHVLLALVYADSEINNFFGNGPYATPLTMGQSAPSITHWAVTIAGHRLYTARGQLDTVTNADGSSRMVNRYSGALKSAYNDMGLYKSGIKRLDSQRRWPQASAPQGVRV